MKVLKVLFILVFFFTVLAFATQHSYAEEIGYVKMGSEMILGKPVFYPGDKVAFYLWRTPNTNTVHIRWTSNGSGKVFSGKVLSDVPIVNAVAVRTESEDYIVRVSQRVITFNTITAGDVDGFSFQVFDPTEVRLTLKVDGCLIEASKIYMGIDAAHPTGNPVVFYKP